MTYEEVKKVPFHMVGHLAMADAYQGTYADESGRLGFCDITERINEFETGECHRSYRIDNTWYDTKEEFVEALKHFNFGPQEPKKKGEKQ